MLTDLISETSPTNYIQNGHKATYQTEMATVKMQNNHNQNGYYHNGHRATNVWTVNCIPLPKPELLVQALRSPKNRFQT